MFLWGFPVVHVSGNEAGKTEDWQRSQWQYQSRSSYNAWIILLWIWQDMLIIPCSECNLLLAGYHGSSVLLFPHPLTTLNWWKGLYCSIHCTKYTLLMGVAHGTDPSATELEHSPLVSIYIIRSSSLSWLILLTSFSVSMWWSWCCCHPRWGPSIHWWGNTSQSHSGCPPVWGMFFSFPFPSKLSVHPVILMADNLQSGNFHEHKFSQLCVEFLCPINSVLEPRHNSKLQIWIKQN